MGVGTTADSLAAIERVIFDEKVVTLKELQQALADNFVGHEELHKKLLAAPKYGNDDDYVDKYAVWFTDFLAGEFDKYRTPDGGWFYVAMAANTSNIAAGSTIGATPDGRKAGQPLSDAASPTYGRDVNGPTATVSSVTKPDYTKVACGTVVNQKFSPEMFSDENRPRLAALLRVYFARGGQEMQINATSRQTLIDAMAHPEKYPAMVVRVSGFSAVYVTLAPEVQLDILNRTQQG
jgi:formate C-acetyltransferase